MVTSADVGQRVEDRTGRVGILRDVILDYEDPAQFPSERQKRPTALLRPGGREWLAPPESGNRA